LSDAGNVQVGPGNMDRLVERIATAHGMDLGMYRRPYLERRFAARMRAVGIQSYRRYGDLLDTDPTEFAKLLDVLTINVTEFFRDEVVWDSIRSTVIPELIERKSQSRSPVIRAWSAGCATGEEPYSLAMLLLDSVKSAKSNLAVSVLATDIDPQALSFAKEAVFEASRAKSVSPDYRSKFTEVTDPGYFRLVQEVRDVIRFRKMSLFVDTPVRVIDILLCRNVFIYIDRRQQEHVVRNFVKALSPSGYLVLGRSEKLPPAALELLEPVDGRERIYRKRGRNSVRPGDR